MLETSMKTYHRNLKALMKMSQSSPLIEGLTDETGQVITDPIAIQKHLLDFFKNKYDDKGEKIIFKDIYPPSIILNKDEFDLIVSKISII